ncbi:MAG: replication initiation factor domain-containing protein [Pseudomonadota bacterium]
MSSRLFNQVQEGRAKAKLAPGAARPSPPALTGGGKIEQGAKVDWCSLTWYPDPSELVDLNCWEWLGDSLGGVMGEEVNGMFGYERGVRFYVAVDGQPVHVGRVDYGGQHHGGRARLDLSGTGCSRVRSWPAFADRVRLLDECKLTRVDLAVDALEGEFTVEDAADWWAAGDFRAGTSGANPRHSTIGDWFSEQPKHGRTLEIGRRENGKMCRVYEKGRQLGDPDSPWTRFEVEIRNNERDIPIEILTECDKYFVGAYKCLEQIIDAAAERIALHQKESEISLDHMVMHSKRSYGQVANILRAHLTAEQVLDHISRPGIPRRLERSSLNGFLNRPPPGHLH